MHWLCNHAMPSLSAPNAVATTIVIRASYLGDRTEAHCSVCGRMVHSWNMLRELPPPAGSELGAEYNEDTIARFRAIDLKE